MIIEIKQLSEVLRFLTKRTHLFFDLDNTLIEPIHDFGSVQWEKSLNAQFCKRGIPVNEATIYSSMVWRAVNTVNSVKLVEEESIALLKLIHPDHFIGIATARSPEVHGTTLRQLQEVGLLFLHDNNYPLLHCGELSKAEKLTCYLKEIKTSPELLILVDDTKEHLELAAEEFSQAGIPFIGLRYGYLDQKVEAYKPDTFASLFNQIVTHPDATLFLHALFEQIRIKNP